MNLYDEFLREYDYDVRKSGDARWIDQKCTIDVIYIISDCILEYLENSNSQEFTVSDIWNSDYARENVIDMFSKPDPKTKAKNEYDKYFGQPIKLLSYSRLLNSRKEKNRYFYSINNKEILEKIASNEKQSFIFLCKYIRKVLSDSGLIDVFDNFFNTQTNDTYKLVRDKFIEFTIQNTKINKKVECGRIFTKVINPLACELKKLGTKKGVMSKIIITYDDLRYNHLNWRDESTGKDKAITRSEYEFASQQLSARAKYSVNRAKKIVRKFNEEYNNGKSEVKQINEVITAQQIHHIFPVSSYPSLADAHENLIALTQNQHFHMAHPNNNTKYIDKDYQYICLLAKTTTIYNDLMSNKKEKIYDFEIFMSVLDTGLNTVEFSEISNLDFANVINLIDYHYSEYLTNNKYKDLISSNKLILK